MTIVEQIKNEISEKGELGPELARRMESIPEADVPELFPLARALRARRSGQKIRLCSIVNAKSGACPEDCAFCAQSARHKTGAKVYPLIPVDDILEAARSAKNNRAREFSIVVSGKGVTDAADVERFTEAIAEIAKLGLNPCVSPGVVEKSILERWKDAGLSRFHHNLECSRSFFPEVCTTHSFDDDVQALKDAKQVGLKVCAGGLFGMGESWAQRVELIAELAEIGVDSVPVNFLNPIPGTPMAETSPGITPLEALKTIATIRFMVPDKRIILCGGREVNLRDLQSHIFDAGADAMMIGNYLTTPGRPAEEDLQMIADLGLEPAPP